MNLGEKIRYMRETEGALRGMGREMTQLEVVHAIKKEMGKSISQSYLSQMESGHRPHLTDTTRLLLASFFKVHPGYLVDDPEGYHAELISDLRAVENRLDLWLAKAPRAFSEIRNCASLCWLWRTIRIPGNAFCFCAISWRLPDLFDGLCEVLNPVPAQKMKVEISRP